MRAAIIVPCRNVEAFAEGAIRSALGQEGIEADVIAVDDGSTDGTLARLRSLEAAHPGALRVIAVPHAGAGAARNTGLRHTDAPLVRFLDADDALLPGALARQCALMERSGADIVAGAYVKRFPDGRPDEVEAPWPGDAWEGLIRTRLGTTSANLFRRRAVEAVGGWDGTLASSQDYELMFRMLLGGARAAVDAEPSAVVLKRAQGSISRTDERANWLRYLDLRRAMRDHLRTMGPGREAAVAVADQYLFMAIRVLSAHDRRAAREAHDRLLPPGFAPEAGPATSARYVRAYRLLGFRGAECLAALQDALTGR